MWKNLIFPCEKIEFGETHEETAARELLEETGYRAKGKMKSIIILNLFGWKSQK